MGATRQPGEDVLVRYLSDSLRLVEGALRKNSPGDIKKPSIAAPTTRNAQQDTVRRPASDVMAFRRTSEPKALEVKEKLRHSMQQASGGSGMVRWSSTGRRGGSLAAEPKAAAGGASAVARADSVGRYQGNELRANPPTGLQKAPAASGVIITSGGTKAAAAAASKPSLATSLKAQSKQPPHATKTTPAVHSHLPQGSSNVAATRPGQGHQQASGAPLPRPRPPQAPSEAGTHADWWQQRPGSSSSSVISYPMTAVTDRGGSVTSTEFQAWMERISQLENAVNDERSKRQQFQEELKKIQKDALFAVSRGGLKTGAGAASRK